MDSVRDLPCGRGCPIRRPADQRALAPPRSFSQRATSFIASWRQGIHQMPLPKRLIAKPVARRDKPRSQQVSHEDALLALEQLTSVRRQRRAPPAILPESLHHRMTATPLPRYSLFTLSKIKNLASSSKAHEANRVLTRSYGARCLVPSSAPSRSRGSPRQELGSATAAAVDTNDACRVVRSWWAREDLNLRPHAYQARALTN